MKKLSLILALAGLSALTASASLYQDSFESGLGNWITLDASVTTAAVSTQAGAATAGSNALEMSHTLLSGQVDLIRLGHAADPTWWAAMKDPTSTKMSVDIFLTAAVSSANWSKVGMRLDGSEGSVNVEAINGPDYVKGEDSSIHLELDFSSLDMNAATWSQVTLYFHGAPQADLSTRSPIYADNYEVIPEPATFGLMGLAGFVVLALRRLKIS